MDQFLSKRAYTAGVEAMAMKNTLIRIAMWASAGFVVSLGWGFYFASTNKGVPIEPAVYALARLTQPIAALVLYLNPSYPLGVTWAEVANAATYALVGLIVETIGQGHRALHISN
jgi:hypothetical protein